MNSVKPLGAYKCAQSLRENGYSCLVVDRFHTFSDQELDELLSLTVDQTTKFIGFSTTYFANSDVEKNPDGSTPQFGSMNESFLPQGKDFENMLIKKLRKLNSNIKIVVGGGNAPQFQQNKNINYMCLGYSEASIINLMKHLCEGTELADHHRNLWGVTIINDKAAKNYDFVNSKLEWLDTDVVNQKILPLEVARGCIFKCKFCAYPMNGKQNLEFIKTEDQLRYELERNYEEFGIYKYQIIDDTFNDNDYKLTKIKKVIDSLKFQPEFWAYLRLDLISRNYKKYFAPLYDLGVRAANFGIETMNPETAKIIGKGYDRERQIETLQNIWDDYENKFFMTSGFIVGLPEESIEQVEETNAMLLSRKIPLHTWMFYPLILQPHYRTAWKSELEINYDQYGYEYSDVVHDYPGGVEWKNKFMKFSEAAKIATRFNSAQRNFSGLTTQKSWGLHGSFDMSMSELVNTPFNQLNFNRIENLISDKDNEYKIKLFQLLKQKQ
jgi:radical SAM superfamily enzyme YgiQ (UPF0313 family)